MGRRLTRSYFGAMVDRACALDPELRHEIEREKDYDSYDFTFEMAYEKFSRHHLTIREAFGMTERG